MSKIDKLTKRVRQLEEENARLNAELAESSTAYRSLCSTGMMRSIVGLGAMVCQLSSEEKVAYLNTSMSDAVGQDSKAAKGKDLWASVDLAC